VVTHALRLVLMLLAALVAVSPVRTQSYPSRPIKLITPFTPGGPVDVMARLVADGLSQNLGTVVVDNRPGAGGTIGSRFAATAEPDGYTLLLGTSTTLAASPALYRNIGYDPIKSFTPVAMVASVPMALVVAPGVPAKTVGELIAYAKAHPGKLNYGAPTGVLPHLTAEMFKHAAGVDIVHVPYKGAATAINDLLSGQIDLAFEPYSVLLGHIHEGRVRALAVTGATRSAELPDTPTMIQSGLSGFTSVSWSGVVAPSGTPAETIAKLNAAVNAGLATPETQARLTRLGAAPMIGTPEEFAALIAAETPKWAAVVKAAGIRIE
jgi:tripartite-type tricarboxylate transporter receptor subunit TctC